MQHEPPAPDISILTLDCYIPFGDIIYFGKYTGVLVVSLIEKKKVMHKNQCNTGNESGGDQSDSKIWGFPKLLGNKYLLNVWN